MSAFFSKKPPTVGKVPEKNETANPVNRVRKVRVRE